MLALTFLAKILLENYFVGYLVLAAIKAEVKVSSSIIQLN